MTMDVSNNRKVELKTDLLLPRNEEQTEIVATKTIKRPFDVAFLMQPDDKMKQKQMKIATYVTSKSDSDEDIEIENDSNEPETKYFTTQKQQIFDDPNLNLMKPKIHNYEVEARDYKINKLSAQSTEQQHHPQKSAFTKVSLNKESRTSPNLSLSPDINYQNSLSPSPPIINRNYANFTQNMLTSTAANHILKTQQHLPATYQNNFIQENPFTNTATLDNNTFVKTTQPDLLQQNFKMRPMLNYRPDLSYSYAQFQPQEMLKITQPDLKFAPDIRNPAAAILHSLLPPSLAALSLPAQNVCAKCNITFRMTSDLVYHMRSHHKNDSVDFTRKRREDKLKCPVCSESFRERHHLTRHMTAHQDKDNDNLDNVNSKKKNYVYNNK